MKFLKDGSFNNNGLLRLILCFALIYILILWVTNILIYVEKIGFRYTTVVDYYLGSEVEFKNPVSYRGLLEITHFHLFVFGMALLILNHLVTFTKLPRSLKLSLITLSFLSGLVDIGAGWLVRFVSPQFAYLKIGGFIVFQLSLLSLLVCSFFALRLYRQDQVTKASSQGLKNKP